MGIGEKEGKKKKTRMCVVLKNEDVKKLTFSCIIFLVKWICANKNNLDGKIFMIVTFVSDGV